LHGLRLFGVRLGKRQGLHRRDRRGKVRLLRLRQQPVELRAHEGMALPGQLRVLATEKI
jgi:hypothetical protein